MSASLRLSAPAKLNLFLHITGRRADGYHNLQTVFQLLDYCDQLEFSLRQDKHCTLSPPIAGIEPEDNLIIKAARALQSACSTRKGADIAIDKKIPMGGGLGGGSSNAASTLLALNYLWEAHLSLEQLCELGIELGADVPVFIRGHSAWAEGIGEKLSPLALPEQWFLVIKPDCHVATEKIFLNQELTRDTSAITVAAFFEQGGKNDCEFVVCKHYPEVAEVIDFLRKNGNSAQLTGTGACVFTKFSKLDSAEEFAKKLPSHWDYFIAKGINDSSAHQQLPKITGV